MNKRVVWSVTLGLTMVALVWLLLAQSVTTQETAAVSGIVMELDGGPVAGAVVRQQATSNATTSAADGSFSLGGLREGIQVVITAWHEGYLIGWARVSPPESGVIITVKPHYTTDNPDYEWFSSSDPDHTMSCMHCMVAHPQWRADAHANSATNPRFFSIYNGTHISDTITITPGYKLDFPGTAGNCAACHAPIAAIAGIATPFTGTTTITGTVSADMNELSGVETEGSSCEFCHKVGDVYLDSATGLPYDDRPGVLSMRLYRSPPSHVLWFGTFDDVTRRVTYLELEKKSQFCAPCHQFSFGGTPIYQSFKEWLESPYPSQGIECRACHMAPTGVNYFAFPEKGGLIRDPALISSHLQPGASDVNLLQNTVNMAVSAQHVMGSLQVTVTITNTGAGHHVPTDHPGRHLLLVITATDGQGQALPLQSGPTVPDWGGAQAGRPGKAYAKVLRDEETGESPVVSYWKPTTIVSDNRIPALGSDTSVYTFDASSASDPMTVIVQLRFRRLFQAVMDAKGWDTPDVVMEETQIKSCIEPCWDIFLPLVWSDIGQVTCGAGIQP
jgi:hypothetical protein